MDDAAARLACDPGRPPVAILWVLRIAAALALLLAVADHARADTVVVALRAGSHPDYGRLVFDWPQPVEYEVRQDGDRITLRFGRAASFRLGAVARGVRNLRSLAEAPGGVVIETAPGARLRHFRMGNRIVLDIQDARPGTAAATVEPERRPVARERAPSAAVAVAPVPPASAPPPSTPPAAASIESRPAPEAPSVAVAAPVPVSAATPAPAPSATDDRPLAAARPGEAAAPPPAPPASEAYTRQEIGRMSPEERLGLEFFAVMSALDPNPPRGAQMFRYFLSRNLRHLGYGETGASAMPDGTFREAVAAYQRQIGETPTGWLTLAEGQRLLRTPNLLAETRISAGPLSVTFDEDQATASGTWVGQERPYEFPVNRSHITCVRQEGRCFEAASRVALAENEASGVLLTSFVIYQVASWTEDGLRAEIDWPCVASTLEIRRAPGQATVSRRPKDAPECRGSTDYPEGTLALHDGFDSTWLYYQQRRAEALGDISPALRVQMENMLSGAGRPSAAAEPR